MDQLFTLTVPWYLLVLRSILVYLFLFVLFRFAGRRQIGEFTNFDLILVLILASAVGNALTGGDTTLLGGMISGGTIFVITVVVGRLTAAKSVPQQCLLKENRKFWYIMVSWIRP